MTQLKYSVPSVGEKNTVAEPKVDVALAEIKTVVNGELNSENIAEKGVNKDRLSAALQTELSSFTGLPLEAKKSIISTEQERESAVFGVLGTPDEVEVTLAENGLIAITYQATWFETVGNGSKAAIFIGGNQLKIISTTTAAPVGQEATCQGTNVYVPLVCGPGGLVSAEAALTGYAGNVATGQVLGAVIGTSNYGGPCYVFAAAGTYKISVRFKASLGKVKVKERALRAWIIG